MPGDPKVDSPRRSGSLVNATVIQVTPRRQTPVDASPRQDSVEVEELIDEKQGAFDDELTHNA
jgi:hypothetical protein